MTQIKAMRWDGTERSQHAIITWSNGAVSGWFDGVYFLSVGSAQERVDVGDWVVRADDGTYHARKHTLAEVTT